MVQVYSSDAKFNAIVLLNENKMTLILFLFIMFSHCFAMRLKFSAINFEQSLNASVDTIYIHLRENVKICYELNKNWEIR